MTASATEASDRAVIHAFGLRGALVRGHGRLDLACGHCLRVLAVKVEVVELLGLSIECPKCCWFNVVDL